MSKPSTPCAGLVTAQAKMVSDHLAFPKELRRILLSPDIAKVGVRLTRDISVLWDDLRTEMENLVDVGMMARLLLAEKYLKQAYSNMSLEMSVEDVLGYSLKKDLGESNWSLEQLSDEQKGYERLLRSLTQGGLEPMF